MGKRRKKKENTPVEIIIALLIGALTIFKTQDIKKSAEMFILSLAFICIISFSIRYMIYIRRRNILLNSGIDIVNKMTGEEFEQFLLVHFEKLGYKGKMTPTTNDYGADLILKKDTIKIVVQAKRYKSKVGIEAVQQIIGAKEYYKADKCMVVTNNYFTPNAINLAISSNVELWDRDKLIEVMNLSDGREIAKNIIRSMDINNKVICSKCGGQMILKNSKYGNFYGCTNYPKCNYTKKCSI